MRLLTFAANKSLRATLQQFHKLRTIVGLLSTALPQTFDVYDSKYSYPKLLAYFCTFGHTKVINSLLKSIQNPQKLHSVLRTPYKGRTAISRTYSIDTISEDNYIRILTYFFEFRGGIFIETEDIETISYRAASRGHLKIFKFIETKWRGMRHRLNAYLYVASEYGRQNVVKYLWEKYRNETTDSAGNTALHSACDGGALESIQYLLKNGCVVNARNNRGRTPSHFAAEERRLDVLTLLFENGADMNSTDIYGHTPLDLVITEFIGKDSNSRRPNPTRSENIEIIKYLLFKCDAKIAPSSLEFTRKIAVFLRAELKMDLETPARCLSLHRPLEREWAAFLVEQGADINFPDNFGQTPMHWAAAAGNTQLSELYLQSGAVFDAVDSNGLQPRNVAKDPCSKWLLELLETLFQSSQLMLDIQENLLKTADTNMVESTGPYYSWYPDVFDRMNPIQFILNTKNSKAQTLLHVAAKTRDAAAANCLVEFNRNYLSIRELPHATHYTHMNINAKDYKGNTPLHYAAKTNCIEIVCLLLKEGAIFNAKNNRNEEPGDLAMKNGGIQELQKLKFLFNALETGDELEIIKCVGRDNVELSARTNDGKTALHLAAALGHIQLLRVLLCKSIPLNMIHINGMTPLHIAAKSNT